MAASAGAASFLRTGWRRFRQLRGRWQVAIVLGLLVVPRLFDQGSGDETNLRSAGRGDRQPVEDAAQTRPGPPGTTSVATVDATRVGGATRAFVERVIDGDTLVLTAGTKVRLIGVDTPETKKPGSPVECFGAEASRYTEERFGPGTEVRVVYDVERFDRYGRTLVYLYRLGDGLFLNLELLRDGFAEVATFPPNVAHVDEFLAAQRSAREEHRGLWGASCDRAPVAPPPTSSAVAVAPPTASAAPTGVCHPSYDPCVPVASDADCAGGSGNGPVYVEGPVNVIGPDEYQLDSDHDGVGCER